MIQDARILSRQDHPGREKVQQIVCVVIGAVSVVWIAAVIIVWIAAVIIVLTVIMADGSASHPTQGQDREKMTGVKMTFLEVVIDPAAPEASQSWS